MGGTRWEGPDVQRAVTAIVQDDCLCIPTGDFCPGKAHASCIWWTLEVASTSQSERRMDTKDPASHNL